MRHADPLLLESLATDELRHRLACLTRLLEVAQALAAEIDLPTILRTVTTEVCRALDCERASLYQYDPKSDELYTSVVTELEISEIRRGLDHGVSGYVARNRVVANVADPALDPHWSSSVDRATGFRTRNILAAPLTSPHDGGLLGVLQLLNKRDGAFGPFDEELIVAFSQHAATALDRARLVEQLRQRDVLRASLEVARGIQQSFMPDVLPEVPGYDLATWWFPNEAVGGDYCDVLPLRDGRIGLVIADVSGHGLGPSLLMASARAALHALSLEHSEAQVLLKLLARSLAGDLQGGRFITMALAALDAGRHTIEFANAGHAPALHFSAAAGTFAPLEATGLPLGVLDHPEFPPGPTINMQPGDILLLCTDGIVEALDPQDQQFGQQRVEELVRRHAAAPILDLVGQIGNAVEAHYEGDNPPDDLTILAVRRRA